MISRRITLVLLCGCLALPALMYVRDLGASPPPPTAGEAAFDAGRLLGAISPGCGNRCSVKMLGQAAAHTWRVRLSIGAWHRCYDLDASAFSSNPDHGFGGLTTAACRRP